MFDIPQCLLLADKQPELRVDNEHSYAKRHNRDGG